MVAQHHRLIGAIERPAHDLAFVVHRHQKFAVRGKCHIADRGAMDLVVPAADGRVGQFADGRAVDPIQSHPLVDRGNCDALCRGVEDGMVERPSKGLGGW